MPIPVDLDLTIDNANLDDSAGIQAGGSANKLAPSDAIHDAIVAMSSGLPSQTGNNGKFLTTNGSSASWDNVSGALPSQTGNNGKFLTTNGSAASWATISSGSSVSKESNLLINGAHVLSQENVDTSLTGLGSAGGTETYITDQYKVRAKGSLRVSAQRIQSTSLSGFVNALRITTTTAESSIASGSYLTIEQPIEGFRVSRLGFGASGAAVLARGVWVRSSVTGTFSAYLTNSARNRSNPSIFTISSANTWEYKTLIFNGDTSGTWLTDTGVGLRVVICLAAGSSLQGTADTWTASEIMTTSGQTNFASATSRTFDITGDFLLPLENGSVSNPLTSSASAILSKSVEEELPLALRYFEKSAALGTAVKTQAATVLYVLTATTSVANGAYFFQYNYGVRKRTGGTVVVSPYTTFSNTSRISNSSGTDYAANSGSPTFPVETGFQLVNNSGGALTITSLAVIFSWYCDDRLS